MESRTIIQSLSPPVITVTKSKFAFTLINRDFEIASGTEIRVIFPTTLTFCTLPPTLTPGTNLDAGSLIINSDYPMIAISRFPAGLSINTTVQFEVDDILTSYMKGPIGNLRLYISQTIGDNVYEQFVGEASLEESVTKLADFDSCEVHPGNYITSTISKFEIGLRMGDGALRPNDQIIFRIPVSVAGCAVNTININTGMTTAISEKGYYSEDDYYYFDIPQHIGAHSYFTFSILCHNPETERETGEFIVKAGFRPADSDMEIFYSSSAGSVKMTTISVFPDTELTQTDPCPLCNNTFSFRITRTANFPSTDINQIEIIVPTEMDPSHATVEIISGVTRIETLLVVDEQRLRINGISELEHIFVFRLAHMENPALRASDIQFQITSGHTDGYRGESANTSILHTSCNFPCATCPLDQYDDCATCFPLGSPIFESWAEEAYILYTDVDSMCVGECPQTHYVNTASLPTCMKCIPQCLQCELNSNNCTKCVPNTYLLNNQCSNHCPVGYSEDTDNWECHLIQGFLPGSGVSNRDTQREIQTLANYTFTLLPQLTLPINAILWITSSTLLGLTTSQCYTSASTSCTVLLHPEQTIDVGTGLTEDYLEGESI